MTVQCGQSRRYGETAKRRREPELSTCKQCGAEFWQRHKRGYCSQQCKSRADYERRKRKPGYKPLSWSNGDKFRPSPRNCAACGREFRPSQDKSRFCGADECRRWSLITITSCPVPDEHPSRSTLVPRSHPSRCEPKPRFAGAACAYCGTSFVMDRQRFHSMDHRHCSARCAKRNERALRSYRRRTNGDWTPGEVRRYEIFERDGWRCHLCGKRTKRDADPLDPRSATLDHIVPLSLGGAHTRENVATACRSCNSRKSNRGAGDQLALIG